MKIYHPHSMLVTGGAGFIGANFVRYILNNDPDIHITNIDKLTYAGSLDNLQHLPNQDNYHFIQGDITDARLIRHIMTHHHIDTIVHFAAESHVDRSIKSAEAFVESNVLGTYVLLEAARHHWFEMENCHPSRCRFHHISTDEVYGSLNIGDPAFTESTPYHPNSPYSATKAGSDHLARAYHHTYGLPVTISNCSNNYGPYQHKEKFIPTVINACLKWESIPIYGNGKNIRDWLYVEDHVKAIDLIIKKGKVGETYNIGGSNEWENMTLAKYICEQMDKMRPQQQSHKALLNFVTDRAGHDFRYAIDSSKIEKELHWKPQESIESGIKKTIDFYLHKDE